MDGASDDLPRPVAGVKATGAPLVRATAAALGAISALHVFFGLRIRIPGVDAERLTEATAGSPKRPSPAACFAVAAALATASALVGGHPRRRPTVRRAGQLGVAGVLAGRAALGLAGRTDLVAPGPTSARFRRWDRRVYTPLCAVLAAGAARAASRSGGAS
jgi:hypothetical protein